MCFAIISVCPSSQHHSSLSTQRQLIALAACPTALASSLTSIRSFLEAVRSSCTPQRHRPYKMQLPPALLAIAENPVALSRWLVVVAFLRAFSVVTGYLAPGVLRKGVFPTAGQYNSLSGRLFAVWTAVTCAACMFVAVNLENTALVSFAVVTFAVALAYFILELIVFRTVQFRTAISPFIIASAYRIEHSLSIATTCPTRALLTSSTRLCLPAHRFDLCRHLPGVAALLAAAAQRGRGGLAAGRRDSAAQPAQAQRGLRRLQ